MFGIESKGVGVEPSSMIANDTQTRLGIALLALAGVLLFGPVALGVADSGVVGALAVLGLAGGACLVGTAEEGRPV